MPGEPHGCQPHGSLNAKVYCALKYTDDGMGAQLQDKNEVPNAKVYCLFKYIDRYHANRYGAKPKAEDGIAEYEQSHAQGHTYKYTALLLKITPMPRSDDCKAGYDLSVYSEYAVIRH